MQVIIIHIIFLNIILLSANFWQLRNFYSLETLPPRGGHQHLRPFFFFFLSIFELYLSFASLFHPSGNLIVLFLHFHLIHLIPNQSSSQPHLSQVTYSLYILLHSIPFPASLPLAVQSWTNSQFAWPRGPDTDLCLSFISNPGTQSSNAPGSHSENTRQLGFITVPPRYTSWPCWMTASACTPHLRLP